MTRALVPTLNRAEGVALRRVAEWEQERAVKKRSPERSQDIVVSEDGQTYYYINGGNDPAALWQGLARRDLVRFHDHLFETYGFAGDVPRKLLRVELTERGRAALVVFDATHDTLGRRPRAR